MLLKSDVTCLYHTYWSRWRQLSWKESLLVIWKLLALFVNTLTANDKYSLLIKDNLTQPIQTQLSKKQKTLSLFFSAFLKSKLNFEHVEIWTPAPLSYLLITVEAIELEESLLVICKMLRLFLNTFTADDKYSVLNRDYLTKAFQKELSKKPKSFSELFCAFFKSRLNFEHFQKKDDPHSLCIS